MKHIKLFEHVASSMPNVATVEEIKNMTPDQFLDYAELYLKEGNAEQLFTLNQIWFKYNKNLALEQTFLARLGKMSDAMESLLGPKYQELKSVMNDLKIEKDNAHRLRINPFTKEEKIEALDRGISNAEREISDLQRYIENSRRELQSLRSSM